VAEEIRVDGMKAFAHRGPEVLVLYRKRARASCQRTIGPQMRASDKTLAFRDSFLTAGDWPGQLRAAGIVKTGLARQSAFLPQRPPDITRPDRRRPDT
jgi:hypothetical protein